MPGAWLGFGLIIVVLVVAMALIAMYNRLVVLRNRVDNAWAQIDVQLKRRYDLIPNLVNTVKGYASHEAGVFEAVSAARAAAMGAKGVEDKAQAENQLSGALKSLFAVAEAYPQLMASGQFQDLQNQLTDTENKIAYARQFYNDSVMSLSTAIQSFPANLVAGAFGFTPRPYFEAEDVASQAPQVQF
jgi:LemA protein